MKPTDMTFGFRSLRRVSETAEQHLGPDRLLASARRGRSNVRVGGRRRIGVPSRKSNSRVYRRTDGYTETALAEAARDHMKAALILFDSGPFNYDSAGYLAHLATELLFKVMLLLASDEFPSEHDLHVLLNRLRDEIPGLQVTDAGTRAVALVNRFKELRYPRPQDPVEIGSEDVDLIASLYNTFWGFIPEDLRPSQDPNGWVMKGGRVLMRKQGDAPNNAGGRPSSGTSI